MSTQAFAAWNGAEFMTIAAEQVSESTARFAAEVRDGLCRPGQKTLPSKYLYDPLGSALFDAITLLPEYGLTRADERLLRRYADAIATRITPGLTVVELGSGSGRKTRPLLEAISAYQRSVSYYAIDGSASALEGCRH